MYSTSLQYILYKHPQDNITNPVWNKTKSTDFSYYRIISPTQHAPANTQNSTHVTTSTSAAVISYVHSLQRTHVIIPHKNAAVSVRATQFARWLV